MNALGIGINADAGQVDGRLDVLQRMFDYYHMIGCTHVELAPHGCGAIIDGYIRRNAIDALVRLTDQYSFKYTVHAPNPLNLMDMREKELHVRMFRSTLEFASAVSSSVVVYHAGRYVPEETFVLYKGRSTPGLPTLREREAMRNQERDLLRTLGDDAYSKNITICVENARPYLDASPYCYAESPCDLAEMIETVGHPSVKMTLDTGHAYLAAEHQAFDLISALEQCAPAIRHIHLHDNCGRICSSTERKQHEMVASGRGDMHAPPGWGNAPLADMLGCLPNYQGVIIVELRPRYSSATQEALATATELASGATGTASW